MNKLLSRNFIAIIFILCIHSCFLDKTPTGEFSDEFYLRHKDADLPVWVRGNSDAKTFILFLHGGPFDTAIENAVWEHFRPLYENYAMVFFDQRGGGYAHGQPSANLNENQFVEDVEMVYQLIQQKYPQAENVFLMGHSYGGYLGTAVLKKDNNQNNYKGWIELAGAHNLPLNWLSSRAFSMNYAQQKIDANQNADLWREKLEALDNTPEVNSLNELRIINSIAFEVASELNAGKSVFDNPSGLYILSSPVGAGFSQHNTPEVEDMLVNGNHNPQMPDINLPSLLIYGAEDPIVPVESGENGMEYLGTPEADKYLLVLENSGHSVWEYEPDIFFEEINNFIANYE